MGSGGIAHLDGFHGEVVPHLLGKVLLEAVAMKEEAELAEKVWHTILRHTIR